MAALGFVVLTLSLRVRKPIATSMENAHQNSPSRKKKEIMHSTRNVRHAQHGENILLLFARISV